MLQLSGVAEIHLRDSPDAFHEDVGGRDLLAECQRRKQHELGARVKAIDIGAGVGLGVSQTLRLFQHRGKRHVALFHFGEDVVAGAVQDAVERLHAVARNALAQHRMNRDAAAHAGLHRQIDAGADGAIPDFGTASGHEFLVGSHHRLAMFDGRVENFRRYSSAAHQFGDDLHIGMRHHFPPVGSFEYGPQRRREFLRVDGARAHRDYFEPEPQLERNLIGILRQDGESARAHIAETDNTETDFLHLVRITIREKALTEPGP